MQELSWRGCTVVSGFVCWGLSEMKSENSNRKVDRERESEREGCVTLTGRERGRREVAKQL